MLVFLAKFSNETTNVLTWSKHNDPTVKTGQRPGSQEKLTAPNSLPWGPKSARHHHIL